VGGKNIDLQIDRAQVYRDLYYIALSRSGFSDFGGKLEQLRSLALPRRVDMTEGQIAREVYSHPELWSQTKLFALRDQQQYRLGEDQYFPLGDNSAQSSDARMWNYSFVEGKYLLGKALLVFWPHSWSRPLPITPNFRRMGLIR
jgi:signal peptidase I